MTYTYDATILNFIYPSVLLDIKQSYNPLFLIINVLSYYNLCLFNILVGKLPDDIVMLTYKNRMCSCILYILKTISVHLLTKAVDKLDESLVICH